MPALPDLSVKFIADTAGFTEGTQQMTRAVENARRSVESNLTGLQSSLANFARGFAGAFAVSAIINEIINFGKATVDWAAGLDAAARQVGVTTEQLQQFQYAAIQGGATTQQLESALGHLTETLGRAAERQDAAIKKFADLGVSIRDVNGAMRPTADVMADVVTRLAAIQDPALRAARGTALLGEAYRALAPMINDGAAALTAAREAAPVLAAEWSHRADELMTSFTNMSRQLRVDVAPAFIWLGEQILNMIQTTASAAHAVADIWDAFANLINAGSLTGQLARAEAELVQYGTAARNAEAEVSRLTAAGGNPATIANMQLLASAMRQAEEGARNTRNDLAAAISVTQPTPVSPPPPPGAITRGGVRADAAAARERQRLQDEETRRNEQAIKDDNKTIDSLDRLAKASADYTEALARLADARRRDMINADQYRDLQGRALTQYRDHALAAVQLTEAFRRQGDETELLSDRVRTLNNLQAAGAITANEYANLMRRATAEASLGAEGWKNFQKASEGIASGITDGLEAALTKAKTVREALADIVTEIQKVLLHELLMAPIRAAISAGVQSVGSWAFGSSTPPVGTGIGHAPLAPMQEGGIATSATRALIGEGSDPEAVIPMPGGRGVPVVMKGGGGVQANAVFNIDARNADAGVERRIMTALRAYEPGLIGRLMDQAKRGGTFAKAFGRA